MKEKNHNLGHLVLTIDKNNVIQIGNDIFIELPTHDKYGRLIVDNYQQRLRITAPRDVKIGRIKKET